MAVIETKIKQIATGRSYIPPRCHPIDISNTDKPSATHAPLPPNNSNKRDVD